jgi:oligosaccharide repeat unit polymerase
MMDIIYTFKTLRKTSKITELKHNQTFQVIGIIFLFLSFPAIIYITYLQFMYVRDYGYGVLFTGVMREDLKLPFWASGMIILFNFGYLLMIASRPPKSIFLICSLLYLVYGLLDSLKGQRTIFLTIIITIIYFYIKLYNKKISIRYMFFLLILIISFSSFMSYYRFNKKIDRLDFSDLVLELIYGQGTSIVLPLTIIEHGNKLQYHQYPFIFSPLLESYYSRAYPTLGQNKIRLEKYNLINDVITYYQESSHYFKGYGLGGSFLAEMYDCGGIIGIVFWSWIFALILWFIDLNLYRNAFCVFFFWWIVRSIAWLPRSRLFHFMYNLRLLIVPIAMLLMVIFFVKYTKANNRTALS